MLSNLTPPYRTSDSYTQGTSAYFEWLNSEWNNSFNAAEYETNSNINTTPNVTAIEQQSVSNLDTTLQTIKTATSENITNNNNSNINNENINQTLQTPNKITDLIKQNTTLTIIAAFGLAYLVFKK